MNANTFAVGAALAVGAVIALNAFSSPPADRAAATAPVLSTPASLASAGIERSEIEKIVKEYLVANPEIFLEIQAALETKLENQQAEKFKVALASNAKDIYRRPEAPTAGNIDGDITVAEFFDYNCGYCKRSLPDIQALMKADPKVRVVLKELPILSQDSVDAAKIALAAKLQGKYWEVHSGLLESKARATGAAAIAIAERAGVDVERLKKDAEGPEVKAEIDAVRQLAQKMGIEGTPHFLVGDRSIAGAPTDLQARLTAGVAEMRTQGCKFC